MAVSPSYDRKQISNGELPIIFAECCVIGPGGAIRARPMRAQGSAQGPRP